jgi:polygalacturonase
MLLRFLPILVTILALFSGECFAPEARADPITPEQFGALGDGTHDDTVAVQDAVDTGREVWLTPARIYRISARVDLRSGGGLLSDGTAWLVLGTRPGEFDNTSGDPTKRKAKNAVGLFADQTDGVTLQGFGIRMDYQDGLYVRAISIYRSSAFVARNLEITDFSDGSGIVVESTRDAVIEGNHIHDFRTDHSARAQLTGIETDNDRDPVLGASDNIRIVGNVIENLTVSQQFDSAFGYQTDGINIQSPSTTNVLIERNRIANVGEGIDVFGNEQQIVGNTIANVAYFGIKLVHGAQKSTVRDNTIDRAGFAGIILSGGINPGLGDKVEAVSDNIVTGNTITGTGSADMGFPVVVRASPPVGIYLEGREDGRCRVHPAPARSDGQNADFEYHLRQPHRG